MSIFMLADWSLALPEEAPTCIIFAMSGTRTGAIFRWSLFILQKVSSTSIKWWSFQLRFEILHKSKNISTRIIHNPRKLLFWFTIDSDVWKALFLFANCYIQFLLQGLNVWINILTEIYIFIKEVSWLLYHNDRMNFSIYFLLSFFL